MTARERFFEVVKSLGLTDYRIYTDIEAIHRLSLCGDYQTCGLCTKELIGLCRFLQPGENYRKLIQSQIQLLLSVENQHKVPGYAELLSALHKRL